MKMKMMRSQMLSSSVGDPQGDCGEGQSRDSLANAVSVGSLFA
jgi:hypothetical protein